MNPHNHEENGWRSFKGEFRTNFMLPNFIGFGNGITRGFGSIFSLNHPNNLEFQNSSKEVEEYTVENINEDDNAESYNDGSLSQAWIAELGLDITDSLNFSMQTTPDREDIPPLWILTLQANQYLELLGSFDSNGDWKSQLQLFFRY